MAQAYLDYSRNGFITIETSHNIEHLLYCNKVYTFFQLQLAIMSKDELLINNIGKRYQWVNFTHTEKTCRHFISQLCDS